jgi:hypothetical protein
MSAPHYKIEMLQGADWKPTLNWYAGGVFRAPIEEIDPGYPTKIQVTAHGLPDQSPTPVIISGVEGMDILNSKNLAIMHATYIDEDHFAMPVSTVACEWVIGTGEITYYQPTDITDMTFRAQLRSRVHKGEILADLTTANGKIITVENDASIQLFLTAAETAALKFTKAYLDCEAIDAVGGVQRVFSLDIDMIREGTR